MEWQPIETAPKDGTEVILYGDMHRPDDCKITTAKWSGRYWLGGQYKNEVINNQTHWAPFVPPA